MNTLGNSEPVVLNSGYVKGMFLDRIRLVGIVAETKYAIGVPNPFTRRRRARLCQRHLWALDALLSFAGANSLEQDFTVGKDMYLERFGRNRGWEPLLELLDSWYRIQSSRCIVEGTVAETSVLTISGRTDLIVRLGWPLANVFKLLLDQSRQQPRDSSALPKSLLNQSLTKLNVKKLG
jgi:hypothetical protein